MLGIFLLNPATLEAWDKVEVEDRWDEILVEPLLSLYFFMICVPRTADCGLVEEEEGEIVESDRAMPIFSAGPWYLHNGTST